MYCWQSTAGLQCRLLKVFLVVTMVTTSRSSSIVRPVWMIVIMCVSVLRCSVRTVSNEMIWGVTMEAIFV